MPVNRRAKAVDVVAIIPARGGSKSIPRKNARLLAGHPLIAYSIAAAVAARSVTRVLVSTDDPEIRDIARNYGADAPFLRPPHLAADDTTDLPVFLHALEFLRQEHGRLPDVVVHLRPTSPIRPPGSVDEGVHVLLDDPTAHSLRAVTVPSQNPYKMWTIEGDYLQPLIATDLHEPYNMPRQKLPRACWQTGHLDVIRPETILERQSMSGTRILPFVLDPRYAIDIDTLEQWAFAEWLLERNSVAIERPISAMSLC